MRPKTARAALCAGLLLLALSPAASAAVTFTRVDSIPGGAAPDTAFVRTPDGGLHLVFQASQGRNGFDGIGAVNISPSGHVGPEVQALTGWQGNTLPGLALVGGQLESVFGGTNPANNATTLFGISSSDGGASWSAPVDVHSGTNESLAYASPITMAGGTPVLTVPQAGNIVIQQGLGANTPTFQLNNQQDGAAGNVDSAVDAATGAVVVSWQSVAGNPTEYMQQATPSPGAAQAVPGPQPTLVIAGRDSGAGVYGAYSTDNKNVRLQKYGGGSVAVGSAKNIAPKALGVATGLDGRIWVMWGTDSIPGGIALTRSNKAVTKFEPIQKVNPNSGSLYRISGDGRLGPLDLLVDQLPNTNPAGGIGTFYARVLPILTVTDSVKTLKKGFKVTVKVTDAGDAVSGASVSLAGKKAKTNGSGIATVSLPSSAGPKAKLTVTAVTYQPVTKKIKL